MSKRRKKNRGNPQFSSGAVEPRSAGRRPPSPQQNAGSPRILVYALLGITLFLGLYLHAYAMPQLTYFADGLSMPGARITGYDAADIAALQAALERDAEGQLNFLHKTAGMMFPVTVVLATWGTVGLLARGRWRWVAVAAAAVFAAVDITENFLIDNLLSQVPVEASTVAVSSTMTILSWALLGIVSAVVVTVVVRDFILTGRQPRRKPA
ncbi:hypothetical protein [Nesterenkonia sphaerica]|uniref:DUF1772 domain-containing protein n=1 Tax=Nesterenkonia sphaerica TaxID=1804988 RepID=A0A5R9A5U1_9MICC|nr:hypothetical protein [Nesterenkonia sphaerica]TLP74079.1 hypothetical protein FEF27_10035 [Nesterenkonia sphaerica]